METLKRCVLRIGHGESEEAGRRNFCEIRVMERFLSMLAFGEDIKMEIRRVLEEG